MRVLSLDYDPLFGDDEDVRSTFGSDASVFDFDVVIWDPAGSFAEYRDYAESTYQGLPALSDWMSARIQADVKRRRAEFSEFLRSGRTLIVVARPPQDCYVNTGEVQFSGTGRNARRTNVVRAFDITSAVPGSGAGFQRASGGRIETIGDGPLQALIRKHRAQFRYAATMSSPPGSPVAKITGTAQVISSVHKFEGDGLLVLLPEPSFQPTVRTRNGVKKESWPRDAREFQSDLLEAVVAITGSSEVFRPAWSENYATAAQRVMREKVTRQQARVEKAREVLSALQAQAEITDLRDQLYLGTGRSFELRVKDVLESLGGVVTEPEPGRDDWKVAFGEFRAVVEVKGVTKSAAEKQAAQLEKWVASELEETGAAPKGILIVNTWREVPLEDRTEADFPDQMLPYSEGRQHCLLTGLDLYVIACEIDADRDKAPHWRERLLGTSGRLQGVPDWRTYIQTAEADRAVELGGAQVSRGEAGS